MSISVRKVVSVTFLSLGLLVLASVVVPISVHFVRLSLKPDLIDPTIAIASEKSFSLNILGLSSSDYTDASAWFYQPPSSPPVASPVTHFTLTLPNENLFDVTVQVNSVNLKQNAIHFPGTVLPGQKGNSVILGHSSLPQVYKPGSPLTIFNPLVKAKVGDPVIVNFDGVTYRYLITKTEEVKPKEVDVLSPSEKYQLTLITCTPLGTYWRRFVAIAELVQ